jgi:hypothetical protein
MAPDFLKEDEVATLLYGSGVLYLLIRSDNGDSRQWEVTDLPPNVLLALGDSLSSFSRQCDHAIKYANTKTADIVDFIRSTPWKGTNRRQLILAAIDGASETCD